MNKFILIIVSILHFTLASCQQSPNDFEHRIQDVLNKRKPANSLVSFSAFKVLEHKKIADINGSQLMTPASVLKILPTGIILDKLGADFCFETKIYLKGNIVNGAISNGVLVIKGAGDPAFGAERLKTYYPEILFKQVADTLAAMGVKSFSGAIIADASIFQNLRTQNKWLWEDLGNYYGAAPSGLSIMENTARFVFRTGNAGDTAVYVTSIPKIDFIIRNELVAANNDNDSGWIYGDPVTYIRTVRGTIPANRAAFEIKASIPEPELIAANFLIDALVLNHIKTAANVSVTFKAANLESFKEIADIKSAPLAKIVEATNFRSVNLYADHLLLHLGKLPGIPATYYDGIKAEFAYLKQNQIDITGMQLFDGNGLSVFNLVSADMLSSFLVLMAEKPTFRVFQATLPLAGDATGTMRRFDNKELKLAELRAKSGSMTGVLTYSGYIYNSDNELIAFTLMFNRFDTTFNELRAIANEVFIELARSK